MQFTFKHLLIVFVYLNTGVDDEMSLVTGQGMSGLNPHVQPTLPEIGIRGL